LLQAVEDMLQEKVDNELLKSIEARLMKLEEILEDVQQRLKHKVDQLHSNIEEPVVLAVKGALQQYKAKEQEIEKRKTASMCCTICRLLKFVHMFDLLNSKQPPGSQISTSIRKRYQPTMERSWPAG